MLGRTDCCGLTRASWLGAIFSSASEEIEAASMPFNIIAGDTTRLRNSRGVDLAGFWWTVSMPGRCRLRMVQALLDGTK